VRTKSPPAKHRHCPFERCVERHWYREVAGHHFDAGWEGRVFRTPRECAHRRAGAQKFVDHESPYAAGGANDENHVPLYHPKTAVRC
jgi:hypothetical protein